MSDQDIVCARCQRTAPPTTKTTWGGQLGEEIRTRICVDCWAEWENAEVMVINELRLNFMDPKSQEILRGHLREFLKLDDPS